MSKVEVFLNKNMAYQELAPPYPQMDGPALQLKQVSSMLMVYKLRSIHLFDYKNLKLLQSIDLNLIQINPDMFSVRFNLHDNALWGVFLLNTDDSRIYKWNIDSKTRQLVEEGVITHNDSAKTINDIDMNQFVIGRATAEGEVKMVRLAALDESAFYLNCGSKTIKTYLSHPRKPGVSMVKVAQSKIIVVMGNLIRAYSFDLGV
mmetsp:Transcript_19787/g.18835  ORF Transcript_19787/g.18835 Transcript_19787/m.18835 type:complete len:204 (+) Transcript_19787:419-1030(+)